MKRSPSHSPARGYDSHRFCGRAVAGGAPIPKICIRDGECYHCGYDQWLDHCEEGWPIAGVRDAGAAAGARAAGRQAL